ncbi:MAG TPA: IS21 family transposase [Candidatus Micrarchaeia archaeon]|nr:IS21 family transposase [Candidatus Micrarchaeia archaeon]
MAEIERIRWAYHREGAGIRAIARAFGVSRKTVRRAVLDPGPWGSRPGQPRPSPVLDPGAPVIRGWLAADQGAPRKQRHTATRIHQRLVAEYGFTGAESSVRRWVRQHRPPTTRALTVPLVHDPGVDAQFDFGEATVRIGGVAQRVQLFCARLAYSTRDVLVAFPRQVREAWLEGIVTAFTVWDGVPQRGWFDNPSQLGRLRAGTFVPGEAFLALQSAYGFRAHHGTPGQGHEKGLVEGLVGYGWRTYLVPVPDVPDWAALNADLARRTAADLAVCRQGQVDLVGTRFAAEQGRRGPLPATPLLPCTRHPVLVGRLQPHVRFERRPYSVPAGYAGQRLTLWAFATWVEVWTPTACVARHERRPGPGEPITDFWHYLPILARKPGAFDQALPVRQAQFPPEVTALLAALETAHGSDRRSAHREFLAICTLARDHDPLRWRAACATALARGTGTVAGVRAALAGRPLAAAPGPVVPSRLATVTVAAGDPGQYARLLAAAP